MKVAFVHDWLVTYRGGEKVLEAMLELYPDAPIYTLFYDKKQMPDAINRRKIIYPKWLAPFRRLRKALLPLLPTAIESLDMSEFDLIISTSSCVAKGVIPNPDATHICYLHTPMRYIWDQRHEYLAPFAFIPGATFLFNLIGNYLRNWDVLSSSRVDKFLVNSEFVKERVKKYYGRDSTVVHPPIDVDRFVPSANAQKDSYVIAAGAFVSYKRFDLAIKACEKLGKRLIVAGSGPMESKLRKLANGKTQFAIAPSSKEWVSLLQKAEALLFPGVEDFGMVPIESMAAGTPVIAFKRGGAMDYIVPGKTGEFFEEQSDSSLQNALKSYDKTKYAPNQLTSFAQGFSREKFLAAISRELSKS